MRILVLLRDQSPNGITTYNRIVAEHLRHQGHVVDVWPPAPGWRRALPLHRWSVPLLSGAVKGFQPDLIFISHYTQAELAASLSQQLGVPWVACMHNGHSPARMAQWKALFGSAAGVVTMCENLHQKYSQLIGASRPSVLLSRLPIAAPLLAPRGQGPLTLAYCSRMSGQKGPRCAAWLRAVASLPEAQEFKVRVIGGGSYLPQLKSLAQELKLAVEFTGLVPDASPYLADVDVMTGAGYALMEGMVRGASAVALGFAGCWGAVTAENFHRAVAVNFGDHCDTPLPEDAQALAAALQQAIALRRGDGAERLTALARQHFDAPTVVSELADYFQALR
ncbi:glycosyltransferase involved in cell wall biosynthesis [Inhella inkyongensis]|uniref:Glycosyltransferase involved in cell wall biosynthesis n=1 Tax=Inhella inkyongensis TaxID=392593 RepID=A0A840S3U4_9BURK|nr:glycosyltransferase family 4 protein [Inhella inkyongensis]MBB5204118.1 glycosyltransferase involved in cell wall biosynthesis [Inhella inkyongensis]